MKRHQFISSALMIFFYAAQAFAQDFSKVEIKTIKVAGNIYMLQGAGGNIGVSVGPDGILIVDDQYAPLADKIKVALKNLGDGKLKFILNTHYHGDHTGSNPIFGPDAPIISQTNADKRPQTADRRAAVEIFWLEISANGKSGAAGDHVRSIRVGLLQRRRDQGDPLSPRPHRRRLRGFLSHFKRRAHG